MEGSTRGCYLAHWRVSLAACFAAACMPLPGRGEAAPDSLFTLPLFPRRGSSACPRARYTLPATQPPPPCRCGVGTVRAASSPLDSWILPAASKTSRHGESSRPAHRQGRSETGSRRGCNREHADIYKLLHDNSHSAPGTSFPRQPARGFLCKKNKPSFFLRQCLLFRSHWLLAGSNTSRSAWQSLGESGGGTGLTCGAPLQAVRALLKNSARVHETLFKHQELSLDEA